MRQAKREYYNKILKENKDNLKRNMEEVMRNKTAPTAMPNYFINDNREIKDMNQVANEFNSFFCKYWAKFS